MKAPHIIDFIINFLFGQASAVRQFEADEAEFRADRSPSLEKEKSGMKIKEISAFVF